jgi:hypothetical protein
MNFLGAGNRFRRVDSSVTGGSELVHEHKRQTVRSGRLGAGTLACNRCDAPIAIGPTPLSVADQLICPYCDHRGTARDFLSLELPTRPAHVTVRVTYRPVRAGST